MEILLLAKWVAGVLLAVGCLAVVWLRVPPVPSRRKELDIAFGLLNIKPGELVMDLGVGDGRVLAESRAKYGASIMGWELNPIAWMIAKFRLGAGADIRLANLWLAPVERADVVYVFLMTHLMGRVEKQIWARMKPGARLISNTTPMTSVAPTREVEGVYLYVKNGEYKISKSANDGSSSTSLSGDKNARRDNYIDG